MLWRNLVVSAVTLIGSAAAQTDQLLRTLVETSPDLSAARLEAEAARAEVWEARGARLPQLRLEAAATSLDETIRVNGVPGELSATREPTGLSAVIDQTIFASGRVGGAIGAAKATADAAAYSANATEQDVLLQGAIAIANVVRDRATFRVRAETENVVRGRRDESRARREAGFATVTDVSQSEARLAQATAERVVAQGQLERSEALFERVFGFAAPDDLILPTAPAATPTNLADALQAAEITNPDLAASTENRRAATKAVRAERGALMPQISVTASASSIDNERFGIELGEAEQYAVTLNGRWNLFSGGSGYARTRAAKRRAEAAADIERATERQVRERTISAWTTLIAARSSVRARQAQVDASKLAAEGVAAEFRSGRRTRLDVLDADREESDAEVALLAAQRDLVVAEFSLLRSMGRLAIPAR